MSLGVYLDLGHINSLLALGPTLELVDAFSVPVSWHPVSSLVPKVSQPEDGAKASDPLFEYKARRRQARRKFEMEELARNCSYLGLTMEQGMRSMDARQIHSAWLFCQQHEGDARTFAEVALNTLFRSDQLPTVAECLAQSLEKARVDAGAFATWQTSGARQLDEHEAVLLEQGIFDSPGYSLNGERYLGRQHLPLIAWYLNNQEGLPPV